MILSCTYLSDLIFLFLRRFWPAFWSTANIAGMTSYQYPRPIVVGPLVVGIFRAVRANVSKILRARNVSLVIHSIEENTKQRKSSANIPIQLSLNLNIPRNFVIHVQFSWFDAFHDIDILMTRCLYPCSSFLNFTKRGHPHVKKYIRSCSANWTRAS